MAEIKLYALIDDDNYCSQIIRTEQTELANSIDYYILLDDNAVERDYIGRKYDVENKSWTNEYALPSEPEPQPTQLDRVEENELIIMEALAEQYEEGVEKDLMNMEVQATIYESILALGGEV